MEERWNRKKGRARMGWRRGSSVHEIQHDTVSMCILHMVQLYMYMHKLNLA